MNKNISLNKKKQQDTEPKYVLRIKTEYVWEGWGI